MNIELHSNCIGGLQPEAVVILSSDFAVPLYHTSRSDKLRHPLGAYNISIQSILSNLEIVLHQMPLLVGSLPLHDLSLYQGSSVLMEAQKNLLRSIDEHFDDCDKILQAFFVPGANFNNEYYVKKFRDSIQPYKAYVRKIVNHLKHNQGRVRGAFLITEALIIPTYFIEGVDSFGNPGPDPEIHSETNPAISFFRDLRFHFCNLYIVSHYLVKAIAGIVGLENMTPPQSINSTDTQIIEIARQITELPAVFLANEKLSMDIPYVSIAEEANVYHLSLSFPGPPLPAYHLGTRTFVLMDFPSDGKTLSFRLPFPPAGPDESDG